MKIINLEQGTQEWLQWRKTGVTASEIAAILGLSPYKTVWQVWAEKTGLVEPDDLSANPHVANGVRLEDVARQLFEQQHADVLLPVCVESEEHPFLKASLDGLSMDNVPVELKVPSEPTWNQILTEGRNSNAYKLYYPQVQHQLLVTGAKSGWLVFYRDEQLCEFVIERDHAMIDDIIQKAGEFWELVVQGKEPEKDPVRDFFHPQGEQIEQWNASAQGWLDCNSELKSIEKRVKELKSAQDQHLGAMKSLMGAFMHAEAGGLKVTRFSVRGTVDYEKLLSDKGISLEECEPYRKPGSERCKVTPETKQK